MKRAHLIFRVKRQKCDLNKTSNNIYITILSKSQQKGHFKCVNYGEKGYTACFWVIPCQINHFWPFWNQFPQILSHIKVYPQFYEVAENGRNIITINVLCWVVSNQQIVMITISWSNIRFRDFLCKKM